jgi:hypothetical protein
MTFLLIQLDTNTFKPYIGHVTFIANELTSPKKLFMRIETELLLLNRNIASGTKIDVKNDVTVFKVTMLLFSKFRNYFQKANYFNTFLIFTAFKFKTKLIRSRMPSTNLSQVCQADFRSGRTRCRGRCQTWRRWKEFLRDPWVRLDLETHGCRCQTGSYDKWYALHTNFSESLLKRNLISYFSETGNQNFPFYP